MAVRVIADVERLWVVVVGVDVSNSFPELPGVRRGVASVLRWAERMGVQRSQVRLHLSRFSPLRDGQGIAADAGFPDWDWTAVDTPSDLEHMEVRGTPVFRSTRQAIVETVNDLVGRRSEEAEGLLVFLLGHGLWLEQPATRTFLAEDAGPGAGREQTVPVNGTHSIVAALGRSWFAEPTIFYDACSVSADEGAGIQPGSVPVDAEAETGRDVSVALCYASRLGETASDAADDAPWAAAGSPFLHAVLRVLELGADADDHVRAAGGRIVLDLLSANERVIRPYVTAVTEDAQRPSVQQCNGTTDRAVVPLLRLDIDVDPERLRIVRGTRGPGARGVTDLLRRARRQLDLLADVRRLVLVADDVEELLASSELSPAVLAAVGPARAAVVDDFLALLRLDLRSAVVPTEYRQSTRDALRRLARFRRRATAATGDVAADDVVELRRDVLRPLHRALEVSALHAVEHALLAWLPGVSPLDARAARELHQLWALAVAAPQLAARDRAVAGSVALQAWDWVERALAAPVTQPEAERARDALSRALAGLATGPDERRTEARQAALQVWADTVRDLLVAALVERWEHERARLEVA